MWVPIVHTGGELGQLGQHVKKAYVGRIGRAGWDAHQDRLASRWVSIRRAIGELQLDFGRVRLYQDGLPVCDDALRIVRELASQASPNHRLLLDLIEQGARLMGTESPPLLLQEYELNRRILGADGGARATRHSAAGLRAEAARLLEERDRFIASRIATTLEPGECGLVFLGMLHSLENRLPADIPLTTLRVDESRRPVAR